MLDNIPQSDSDHELDNIPQSDYAHVLDNIPQSDYAHVLDNIRQSNYAHVLDNISQSDSYQECLLTGMSSGTEEVSSETEEGPLLQFLVCANVLLKWVFFCLSNRIHIHGKIIESASTSALVRE